MILWPSGDQAAACAAACPSLRGEPPSTGTSQSGPWKAVWPTSSATSRFAPSGETASNDIVGEGAGTCATSPPELDTCAIRETDAGYSLKKIRDPSVPAKAFR